jgi:D-3-phosphoglycerate dehydrogenase
MEEKFRVVIPSVGPRADGQDIEQELPAGREESMALDKIGARVTVARCRTQEELTQVLQDADGILLNNTVLTRQVIENLDNCKVIVRYGIGVDNLDIEAATEHGIVVANTPDFCVEEVANHTIMLILACAKKLILLHNAAVTNNWDYNLVSPMPSIYGQTLGLVGFGNLGRAVVRKAEAFHLQVVAYDPYADKASAWECGIDLYRVDLHQLLRQVDYVSLHVPLTVETRHMLGEEEFRAMKPTAFLINTARGAVVDEKALIKALQEGWIAGAGLDVFEKEPPDADNPLLRMDNVVATIHSAAYSDVAFRRLRIRVGEETARVLGGRWPLCPLNPKVKPRVSLR